MVNQGAELEPTYVKVAPNLRQEQAAARRKQILGVARRLFAENGFAATTIRDVHRAAGVSDGLLYHYFASKVELLHAVVEDGFADLANVRPAEDVAPGTPLPEALRWIGRTVWHRWLGSEELMRISLRDHGALEQVGDYTLPALIDHSARMLAELLEARSEAGEIRPLDPYLAARQFIGSLLGLYLFQVALAGEYVHHIDPEEFIDSSVENLWRGWRQSQG